MQIRTRLKELREAKGLSQNQLARELEMSVGSIQKIEYDQVNSYTKSTLLKLCKALDCTPGDLIVIERQDDEQP